jgi:hypothetical protein
MRFVPVSLVIAASLVAGCAPDDEAESRQGLAGAARRPRAEAIRDVARSAGLTNGPVLGGIAEVETVLSHCWSEAQWACQGPYSPDCNGPVIAGAYDGPCSAQQGGLGMFQFDAGTFDDTLARDGQEILLLDGNIRHAVDFVAGLVVSEGLAGNRADAIAWLNSVPIASGNARFDQLGRLLACRYRGSCAASDATKYKNGMLGMVSEFGSSFWGPSGPPPPPPDRYWVDTFGNANGYASPGVDPINGWLFAGTNYVFCKVPGPTVASGSSYNHWWLKTDLDASNNGRPTKGQYISAYQLSRWGNDEAKDNDGAVIPNCSAPTGKHLVDTFANATGYSSPGGSATGTLNAGTNYVYCKVAGPTVQVGGQFNHWWMLTDLDSGSPAKNQYVSAYYLARWGNDEAKDNSGAVLPDCF